ncbi:membrane-bound PQQ-dependent dehydrogenase, glucose/quinate/shikimate family [Agrobacterium tumefaciens]|uniref:membrane-bound PQQ-dependent dehydrogenase, glucose/quinate/shikimate family n=1 Tax=Agrobacterium tumefaciens TaxID=358 RepID=UPI0021CFE07B|nr:membrane-bound PQQ-dependent dehydrogenase, glucose/quinate/shikimate family [Agrobacterium tumefaciens]
MSHQASTTKKSGRTIYAVLLGLFGLPLVIGGIRLVLLGGSPYYLLAGIASLVCCILVWRGNAYARRLYASILVLTLAWAVWEAGFDFWGLLPRLWLTFLLGAGFLIPGLVATLSPAASRSRSAGVFVTALVAAIVVGSMAHRIGGTPVDPLYQAGTQTEAPAASPDTPATDIANAGNWLHYGNDRGGTRFSALEQLTPANVSRLKPIWTVHVGKSVDGDLGALEVTPLKVGDSVYVCTGYNDVLSIDAETGHVNWRFKSGALHKVSSHGACRGVAYYQVPQATGVCSSRILTATIDARLIALDAVSGQPCPDFGNNGQVDIDLPNAEGKIEKSYYYVSSAPAIVRGKVIFGGWVADNQYWGEPSGVIRGYDAVTGKFAWAFDMGRPDDHAEPKPGESYTHSTPNSWAPMSADEELGMVYVPTGNATPDYYGAQRRPFDDKYSSSVLAIDADTGALRWSFQTTHHDLWDYDIASQPTLIDLPGKDGSAPVHALVQPTKRGEMFLLDRTNGQPLSAVEEVPAPGNPAPGDRLSPTQPFSVAMPSFRGADLRERDMWGTTPLDQLWCRIKFKEARYDGPLTPPGVRPTVAYPGFVGGSDWGSVSVDPQRNLMIVTSSKVPNYDRLIPREEADKLGLVPAGHGAGGDVGGAGAQAGTPFAADIKAFLSPLGAPCNAPPYGLITAVDLTTHKVIWTKPLGTASGSGPFGIPSHLPITMGTPIAGGSLVTRGNLIFVAATQESVLRAIDASTGKELWKSSLPAGGQATPMTYWSDRSKRQFVVIAAGGSLFMESKLGDAIVAYALPKDSDGK